MVNPSDWNPFKSSDASRNHSYSHRRGRSSRAHSPQGGSTLPSPYRNSCCSPSPIRGLRHLPPSYAFGEYWGRPFPLDPADAVGVVGEMSDITTTWGPLTTLEQVQASPSYTRVEIPLNPRLAEQWRIHQVRPEGDDHPHPDVPTGTFTLHAAHPVPLCYLRQMSPDQLNYLYEYLMDDYQNRDQLENPREDEPPVHQQIRETRSRIDALMGERGFGSSVYGFARGFHPGMHISRGSSMTEA